jgi:hypothetical protein
LVFVLCAFLFVQHPFCPVVVFCFPYKEQRTTYKELSTISKERVFLLSKSIYNAARISSLC